MKKEPLTGGQLLCACCVMIAIIGTMVSVAVYGPRMHASMQSPEELLRKMRYEAVIVTTLTHMRDSFVANITTRFHATNEQKGLLRYIDNHIERAQGQYSMYASIILQQKPDQFLSAFMNASLVMHMASLKPSEFMSTLHA